MKLIACNYCHDIVALHYQKRWCACNKSSGKYDDIGVVADVCYQCVHAGVPFYFKQDSGPRPGMQGSAPDELWSYKQFPKEWT